MALSHLLDTTPPSLFTTAACGGLRPAPDYRSRRALLHLSYSSAPSYSDGAFVTHGPFRDLCRLFAYLAGERQLEGRRTAARSSASGDSRGGPGGSPRQTWIPSARLVKILIPQMDQNGGW